MHNILNAIFISIICLIQFSCVGTIKEANTKNTKSASSTDITIENYSGIISAKAIANDKIEVEFPQVSGDSDSIAYVIRYDGQLTPTYIYGSGLSPNDKGTLKYTIKNLNTNASYTLSVQARNVKTEKESTNTTVKTSLTFNNLTANFLGINDIQNLVGIAGATGIKVLWQPAVKIGLDDPAENDAAYYQVTLIKCKSEQMNLVDASSDCARKVLIISSEDRYAIISGLDPSTEYKVQVRCIQKGFLDNSNNPLYKTEQNTKYMAIKTLDSNSSNITFNESSFVLSLPAGQAGTSSIKANWETVKGKAFDHYRIYYTENSNSSFNIDNGNTNCTSSTIQSGLNCLLSESDKSEALITGLKSGSTYFFKFVICTSVGCDSNHRKVSATKYTSKILPTIAQFNGITSINAAKNINSIDQVDLNFIKPDISNGGVYGDYKIYWGTTPENTNNLINSDDTTFSILPYDPLTTNKISIRGTRVGSTYCFKLLPFLQDTTSGLPIFGNQTIVAKCITPTLQSPSRSDFPGFINTSQACDNGNKKITLKWKPPSIGIFSKYEIFYKSVAIDQENSFSLASSTRNGTDYNKISLAANDLIIDPDSGDITYTLYNFTNGYFYNFGILTMYQPAGSDALYSEVNVNTITCSITAEP